MKLPIYGVTVDILIKSLLFHKYILRHLIIYYVSCLNPLLEFMILPQDSSLVVDENSMNIQYIIHSLVAE